MEDEEENLYDIAILLIGSYGVGRRSLIIDF